MTSFFGHYGGSNMNIFTLLCALCFSLPSLADPKIIPISQTAPFAKAMRLTLENNSWSCRNKKGHMEISTDLFENAKSVEMASLAEQPFLIFRGGDALNQYVLYVTTTSDHKRILKIDGDRFEAIQGRVNALDFSRPEIIDRTQIFLTERISCTPK